MNKALISSLEEFKTWLRVYIPAPKGFLPQPPEIPLSYPVVVTWYLFEDTFLAYGYIYPTDFNET